MKAPKILTILCVSGSAALLAVVVLAHVLPPPKPKPYSLEISDRHGRLVHAFIAEDGIWRLRTDPGEIPTKLKRILIQKEDRYFYFHPGVNPLSIVRALAQNIGSGRRVSGASTITMQVARMLEPKSRTYFNKLFEMFRAIQLELRYSKGEILEMYLSIVPLGGNVEGLRTAALIYYQTPPERLNIAQLFDLILIPTDPNNLRPDRKSERLFEERKRRARSWISRGFFSQQDSIILWQTPPAFTRHQLPRQAPHFSLRIREKMRNASEVRTALDLKTQKTTEILLANHMRPWKLKGVRNSAAIIISNKTREIIAYVGSVDFDDADGHGQVDAVKAVRSPGSALKPFLYAKEIDRGVLTPKTRLLDTPYDAEGFYAENYDGKYSGLVSAEDALRRSLNVPMIRLLREAGVKSFISFAHETGFVSLERQKERLGLSLIVGGCGVTLEELAGAYASFANAGRYLSPTYVLSETKSTPKQVFSPSAAYIVTNILSGLDRPDLPNNFESSLRLPKVAFKTGTSYGRRDAWAIGYSAEYTVGIWIGNVNHRGNGELSGARTAAPLLIDIFNSISSSNQKTIVATPSDVLTREVCATSGLVPTKYCTRVIEDLYSVRRSLDRFCTIDREYLLSTDGTRHFCLSCLSGNEYGIHIYQDYPPELIALWASSGKTYRPVPPHNPACVRLFTGDGPKILSPTHEMTYYVFSPNQQFSLHASSTGDVSQHLWYVDDQFLGRESANAKRFVSLSAGTHTISCMDDKGRLSSVKINVKHAM